jgi:dihydrodipicolinate synthase/N-acetylneuraminate lyase
MMATVQPIRPDFSFLTGWEAVLVPMLIMGVDGGTNATSGVVPEVTRKMWDATREKKWDEARMLQLRLLELFDAMLYSADFPEGFRAAASLRGFDFGKSRQPTTPNQRIDIDQLQRVLQCIIADFGFVDAPTEGCAIRTGNVQSDKVQQITQVVLEKLREKGVI